MWSECDRREEVTNCALQHLTHRTAAEAGTQKTASLKGQAPLQPPSRLEKSHAGLGYAGYRQREDLNVISTLGLVGPEKGDISALRVPGPSFPCPPGRGCACHGD